MHIGCIGFEWCHDDKIGIEKCKTAYMPTQFELILLVINGLMLFQAYINPT